jgi:hypothetical protein
MLRRLLFASAITGTLALANGGNATQILLIDSFDTALTGNVFVPGPCPGGFCPTGQVTASSSMTPVYDLSTGAGILDGDRELVLTHTGGPNSLNAEINGGAYSHNNGANTSGSSLLRWDGPNNDVETLEFDLNGGIGYNLSAGSLFFHLFVNSIDLPDDGLVQLTLYSGATGIASSRSVSPLSVGDHFFDVFGFLAVGDVGFALTNITAIELLIEGGGDLDVSLDIVEVVPEPIAIGLFGLGLLGLGATRRRILG